MIAWPEILRSAAPEAKSLEPELTALLDRLPLTDCNRRAECCRLLPQMSLIEAAYALNALMALEDSVQQQAHRRLIEYFLINAARISACPFLINHGCLIYDHRPFGCRAYGLWSPETYQPKQEAAQQAQSAVAQAWAGLGIRLPENVIGHNLPYCNHVKPLSVHSFTDDDINAIEKGVHNLNRQLAPRSVKFAAEFQNDLSFAFVVEQLGLQPALKAKVAVTRELLDAGSSPTLEQLLERIV
jgi:Fe-S-cluster containining protein